MKKIIIAGLLVVMTATSSFAALSSAVVFDATHMGMGIVADTVLSTIGRLSSKNSLGFLMTVTGGGYTLISQHQLGTRSFGSSHDSTAIFWTPETKGTGHVVPTTAAASYFATGWTVM